MRSLSWLAIVVGLAACSTPPPTPDPVPKEEPRRVLRIADRVVVPVGPERAVVRADLPAIKEAGVLRVLIHRGPASSLGRTGSPLDRELALVELFARSRSLPVRFVNVDGRARLLPALLQGKGDMIASQLTVTARRQEKVQFGAPIRFVKELIVAPANAVQVPDAPSDLAGAQIWLRPSSSFAEHLEGLNLAPPAQVVPIDEGLDPHTILYRVGAGTYGLTVADSDVVESYASYRDDVQVAAELGDEAAIAWAVRPSAAELRAAIDAFVERNVEVYHGPALFKGDLDAIKKRGILRIAMPNNGLSYFFFRGAPFGRQYSLGLRLARELGVRLEVVVARRQSDLLPLLLSGRADLVAGTLTETEQRREAVDFSVPLARVDELLVQPAGEAPIKTVEQLSGREVHVRRTSSYWETLTALQATVPGLRLVAVDEKVETAQLIDLVGRGDIPLTVADYDIFHVGLNPRTDVQSHLVVGRGRDRGYAMRKGSPLLKEAVDGFVVSERGRDKDVKAMKEADVTAPEVPAGALSPFDGLARRAGQKHGVDWKLLVAVMEVESGFNPKHQNWIGARGLLGVMPHTVAELGMDKVDLYEPAVAIDAGAARLRRIMDSLEKDLPAVERRRFTLAAYHIGVEHLEDARQLARSLDLDPNVWEEHVERALLLKRDPQYAGSTRFGFCLGTDASQYVSRVDAVLARNAE